MELRQFKYFLKAKELMNFTAAAEALHITQSTLSQQIRQLEEELSIPLFHRIGKRIALTEAGKLFADYALKSVNRANDGLMVMKDMSNLNIGHLSVGVTYALRTMLTKTVLLFSERYPNIKITVLFGTSKELIEKLGQIELDFVLTFKHEKEIATLNYQKLFSSPMTLVVSRHSDLAQCKSVTLEEISSLSLVLPDSGYSTTHYINTLFSEKHLKPNVTIEINDVPTLLELVKTNKWCTILAAISIDDPELVSIPIAGKNMVREATIITLKDAYQQKCARQFQQILNHMIKDSPFD